MKRSEQRPDVILIMTDDQGYPDLGCHGNPWIRTPNIDAFSEEAVRCTDFHVQPLCTPTRGALMTGHRPVRNGAWATCWGRSICKKSEVMMPEIFKASGYRTGMFGKWHLGDNYPYRPFDRGFEHVVAHRGGGVGQTPDFWGNNYFDDTYFHNGSPVDHTGYCTDIWFEEATRWIETVGDEPFFAYIATNAPHSPYLVEERYRKLYDGNDEIVEPAFYGMITNIDENLGNLRRRLQELDLEDNTILIFMTDNGSSGSAECDRDGFETRGYNAGLRGKKGSYYDGGHRVPFFLRWPAAGLEGGREVTDLCLDVDLLPTFIDLCGLEAPSGVEFDGTNVAPLIRDEIERTAGDRVHFLQNRQSTELPEKWANAVMTRKWRLIAGSELYDIESDPGQHEDVSSRHPEVVERLRKEFESWWDEVEPGMHEYCPLTIGDDAENPARLDAMDVMGDVAWHQTHIVNAQKSTGRWTVDVSRPGRYRFRLRRWPEELDLPVDACVSDEDARSHIYAAPEARCVPITPTQAGIGLFDDSSTVEVEPDQLEASFEIELTQTGVTTLDAWFADAEGNECGAYYVYVERLPR